MSKSQPFMHDNSFRQKLVRKLPMIMAFLIPVLVLLVLYIGREIFPFGTNMYLRSDMYHQYAPFAKEFQRNLQDGGSLLYAWNIGLGTNFASTYAYYLASPVNWLIALFPSSSIPEFMNLMLILKAGLMSSLFAYYLIGKYHRNDYIACVFGCFYAMSSYMAAFSWNVMWLDCLVLLPLILKGLEALVKQGRTRLYTICLAVSIISNYYISIMICIFLVFYFVYLLVCEKQRTDSLDVLRTILHFLICSFLAGGMAMFIALPALFHLFITASAGSSFPQSLTAYYNLLEMLSKSLINTETAVFSGHFPNIYSTMALFILVPLYWLSKRVPAREKAGKTLLICLMGFSFMFNVPTYIWHGFHFPNSLPCRYSFLFIAVSLTMGYEALIYIRRFRFKEIVLCTAAGIGAAFFFQTLYSEDITVENACLAALFLLLYLLIAVMLKRRRVPKTVSMILLLAVSIGEIVVNTNETGYSVTSRTTYMSDNEDIAQMLEQVDDGTFYRVEKADRRTKNDGTWNNYNSASVFSSTTVSGNSDLYSVLGMQGRTNAYSYYGHTPVTQALLGVKYEIFGKQSEDPLMREAARSGDYYLYQNQWALSLGFLTDSRILDMKVTVSDPFRMQNELIENACGIADVFHILGSVSGEEASFTADADGRCLLYLTTDVDSCVVNVSRNGETVFHETFDDLETPEIIDALDVEKGDLISVANYDGDVSAITVFPAIMNYSQYTGAMSLLTDSSMSITEFSDTCVKGTVQVSDRKTLFTTIPYDPGWTVYVDGVKTEYTDFEDSFILVELPAGTHNVEFRYWPKGLTPGIIVSLIALACFVIYELLKRRAEKRALLFEEEYGELQ